MQFCHWNTYNVYSVTLKIINRFRYHLRCKLVQIAHPSLVLRMKRYRRCVLKTSTKPPRSVKSATKNTLYSSWFSERVVNSPKFSIGRTVNVIKLLLNLIQGSSSTERNTVYFIFCKINPLIMETRHLKQRDCNLMKDKLSNSYVNVFCLSCLLFKCRFKTYFIKTCLYQFKYRYRM